MDEALVKEMSTMYEIGLVDAKRNGMSREQAKEHVKNQMINSYPILKDKSIDRNKFWSQIGHVVLKIFGTNLDNQGEEMNELFLNKALDDYRTGLLEAKKQGLPFIKCKKQAMNNIYQNNRDITKENIRDKFALMGRLHKIQREFFPEEFQKESKEIEETISDNNSEPFSKIFMRLIENEIEIPPNKFWEALYDKQFNIASYFKYVKDDYDRQKTESGGYIFTKNNKGKIANLEEEYEELAKQFNQAGLDGDMPKVFQLVNKMEEIKKQIAKLNG